MQYNNIKMKSVKWSVFFMWFIKLIALILVIKWGIYDTVYESSLTLIGFLFIPIKMIIKAIVIYFIVLGLMLMNSFCFTNTFKKENKYGKG